MSGGYATKSPPPAAFGVAAGAPQGQWSTGLFDCFDDPSNCFITCCCPCITFGQIAEIIDRGATSCFVGGLIYAVLGGCAYCYTCGFRTKLRGQHSLPEEPCADCCVHYCCTPCAVCQEYRELKNRGYDPALGWATYAGQGGATAAPAMPGMMR